MGEMDELWREIEREVKETRHYLGRDRIDPRVRQAFLDTPRHAFVPEGEEPYAYDNRPLPIGCGQTISQPYIVAIMTDLLDLQPEHVVLEAGTGSGYQAAVLARLARRVYSVELIPELAQSARTRLRRLGISNVETRVGDAWAGWPEAAPFDGILVTAAAREVPPPLLEQLRPGGRMLIPLGGSFSQELVLVRKDAEGKVSQRDVLPVAFVPFVHLSDRGHDQ